MAAIALATGRAVPAVRAVPAGLDRAVPLEGRGHGSWPGPRSTSSSASCPSSPARPPRATAPGASSATWISSLGDVSWTTVLVGAVALAVILACASRRRRCRARSCSWPAASSRRALFDLGAHGVALVGDVPRGLPAPELPGSSTRHATTTRPIAVASFALLLIGFSQTAGDARAFATRHRYRIDVNQESIAQGMANVGAGVFQGMPVSTSLSASSLNESAGARTPVASLIDRRAVLATLVVLAPRVLGPAEGRPRRGHHRRRRLRDDRPRRAAPPAPRDARSTSGSRWRRSSGVLSVGVLAGVVIGVVLSLGWLDLRRDAAADAAARPRGGDARVPRPRRVPGRRDVPGHRGAARRRRPLLRHRRGARGPGPRRSPTTARRCTRSCSISRA